MINNDDNRKCSGSVEVFCVVLEHDTQLCLTFVTHL